MFKVFLAAYCVASGWLYLCLARSISAAGQPDGVFHGARSCDRALPSRSDAADSHLHAGSRRAVNQLGLASRPARVRFLSVPRVQGWRQPVNRRTHRLAFFLGVSRGLRRYA